MSNSEKYWGNPPQGPKMSKSVLEVSAPSDGYLGPFNLTYTVPYAYVYLNGRRLLSSDYTANNGTSVSIKNTVTVKKSDEIVVVGEYAVPVRANGYTQAQVDSLLANKMDISASIGRLINAQRFVTAGTFTYTPTTGTNRILVRMVGAGGQAGGANATGAGQNSSGGGYLQY